MNTISVPPALPPTYFIEQTSQEIVSRMSLEEKIGQLVMAFFWGEKANPELQGFLSRTKIGNVIYFTWSNGLSSPEQVRSLSRGISDTILKATKIPPLIGIDQEGGIVARLQNGFTSFPGNMALGATNDPSLAYEMGKTMGRELLSVGVNCNLAPVVDMQGPLLRPWYMGVRTYGNDPSQVISFTQRQIQGMEEEGLLYVLKHAPGLGSVSVNPHLALPASAKTKEEMQSHAFLPFQKFLHAPAMMTAHVTLSDLDPHNPASLSHAVTTDLMRNSWGYPGVIITDSLSMNAVLDDTSSLEKAIESMQKAATKALLAGADLLILGRLEWAAFSPTQEQDAQIIEEVLQGLIKNVETGVISEERINASVLRILEMKKRLSWKEEPSFAPNENLSHEIALKALTLLSPSSSFFPLSFTGKKVCVLAPKDIEKNVQDALKEKKIEAETYFFEQKSLENPETRETLIQHAKSFDHSLFLSFNATLFPAQITLMEELAREVSPQNLIFVGLRNPVDLLDAEVHKTHMSLLTYSPTKISIESVFDALQKGIEPTGKLPFSLKEEQ